MIIQLIESVDFGWVTLAALAYYLLGLIWNSSWMFGEGEKRKKNFFISLLPGLGVKWVVCFGLALLFEKVGVDLLSQGLFVAALAALLIYLPLLGAASLIQKRPEWRSLPFLGLHFGGCLLAGAILSL